MTRIGTSYFITFEKACRYYREYESEIMPQAELHRYVAGKILDGEIHIGEPPIKAGEWRELIKNEGRYVIVSDDRHLIDGVREDR